MLGLGVLHEGSLQTMERKDDVCNREGEPGTLIERRHGKQTQARRLQTVRERSF